MINLFFSSGINNTYRAEPIHVLHIGLLHVILTVFCLAQSSQFQPSLVSLFHSFFQNKSISTIQLRIQGVGWAVVTVEQKENIFLHKWSAWNEKND